MTTPPVPELNVDTAQPLLLERPSAEVISPEEQQVLQPDDVQVQAPVIVWRSLMLEP